MPFAIPPGHDGLSRHVFSRFRSLIVSRAIDLFDANAFDAWRRNFHTDEEQYFAAQMLCAAVIRTRDMNNSSYRQIVDVILPMLLRDAGLWNFGYVDEMEQALAQGRPSLPIRFMPVDGQRLDSRPGNSGDAVVRGFGLRGRIGDGYIVRADDAAAWRHPPRLLVLLDDLLGTGTQFQSFSAKYGLARLPQDTICVYVPLIASPAGLAHVATTCPRVVLRPVETLQPTAPFFSDSPSNRGVWLRDGTNRTADVRTFYRDLMKSRRVSAESKYSLALTVLLPDRPPNNTLKAYWSGDGDWVPLLRR